MILDDLDIPIVLAPLAGGPATVELARAVSEALGGVDRIALQMTNPRLAHADLLRGIELLGTEVAPRVAASA